MIEIIFNRKLFNAFHCQNGPSQIQHVHTHTGQQQQSRSFQRSSKFLPPYLTENCLACGLNKKEVRELFMHNDGKLETFPFRGSLFIKKKAAI